MLVFLRCDFIPSVSFVHIRATGETKRKEEKGKKHTHMHTTSLWIFFHSAAFFASISPPSVCLAPSSPLCLLSVMVLYHAAAP